MVIFVTNISGILFYLLIIALILSLIVGKVAKRESSPQILLIGRDEKTRTYSYIILLCSLILSWIVVWKRFYAALSPQGFDTAAYIYHAELLDLGKYEYVFTTTKVIPYIITYVIYRLCNRSLFLTGILLPFIFASIYTILTYISVNIATKDSLLSSLCALATPLSFFFIRLTYDLFGQTLGISLLILLLALVNRIIEDEIKLGRINARSQVSLIVLVFAILFSHMHTIIFLLPYLFLVTLYISYLIFTTHKKAFGKKAIFGVISFLIIIFWSFIMFHGEIYWLLWKVIPEEFHLFSFSTKYWYWFVRQEIALVWLLSIIGVLFMAVERYEYSHIFLTWFLYIIVVTLITGYVQSYRFLLYIPLGIYSGAGLYYVLRKICLNVQNKKKKIIGAVLINSLVITMFVGVLSKAYIPQYVYYPPEQSIEQLYYIRDTFGFENKSILVLVYTGYNGSYWWAYAIIGENIFLGSLEMLLKNQTDIFGRKVEVSDNITLILATHIYGEIPEIVIKHGTQVYRGIYKIQYSVLRNLYHGIPN